MQLKRKLNPGKKNLKRSSELSLPLGGRTHRNIPCGKDPGLPDWISLFCPLTLAKPGLAGTPNCPTSGILISCFTANFSLLIFYFPKPLLHLHLLLPLLRSPVLDPTFPCVNPISHSFPVTSATCFPTCSAQAPPSSFSVSLVCDSLSIHALSLCCQPLGSIPSHKSH